MQQYDEDTNNNPVIDEYMSPQLETLANQPTAAAAVAQFYRKLQKSQGPVLDSLFSGDISLGGDIATDDNTDYVPVLEMLAEEQQFSVKFLQLESLGGVDQSLVQIVSDDNCPAVTVCLGTGQHSKNQAARYRIFNLGLQAYRLSLNE